MPALVKVGLGQNIHVWLDCIFIGFENEFLRNIRICFWTGALPRAKFLQFGHFSLNKALAAFEWCQILNPIFLQTQNWTQRTILEIFSFFFLVFGAGSMMCFPGTYIFPQKNFLEGFHIWNHSNSSDDIAFCNQSYIKISHLGCWSIL